jgi:hypothetical protein
MEGAHPDGGGGAKSGTQWSGPESGMEGAHGSESAGTEWSGLKSGMKGAHSNESAGSECSGPKSGMEGARGIESAGKEGNDTVLKALSEMLEETQARDNPIIFDDDEQDAS